MSDRIYAILGDIHGNMEALNAVLEDAENQGAKEFACVGDLVGYNANPAECMEILSGLNCVTVRGNHDHYCSNDESLGDFHPMAASVVDWTRQQLSREQLEYLRGLELSRKIAGFTLVHSTLDMPERWGYVFDCLDADAHFNYQVTTVCFYGHTHVPVVFESEGKTVRKAYSSFELEPGRKYFINVGSVGQPRDGDPRSAYVLYDMDEKRVTLRRLEYDIQSAQGKIRRAGLPDRLARRLEMGH